MFLSKSSPFIASGQIKLPGLYLQLIFAGQSSELAEPLWTVPGLKSGIGVRELIFTLKNAQVGKKA